MKNLLKGAGISLCAMLLLAGCSCNKKGNNDTKANISNPEDAILVGLKEDTKSITLQELYDDLKATSGNAKTADKLIEMVYDLIVKEKPEWKARYDAKVQERLMDLVESGDYDDDGVFDEEILVKTLRAQYYNIACENNVYGPTYNQKGEVEDYLLCDYKDYEDKALKLSIIKEILNEKYVYDKVMKDKENILTTKRARLVEYVSIGFSNDTEEDKVIEHIVKAIEELKDTTKDVTLEQIANSWKEKKVAEIEEKFAKINTKDDTDGAILKEFTNGYTQKADEGKKIEIQKIYDTVNYEKKTITSDSKDILNSTLVEKILSENVLTSNKTIEINGSRYLVAPWAVEGVDSTDVRIKDSTNSKYYIVKVDVVENDSDDDFVYDAVKVLAQNTTLVSDSINYYLEQYKSDIKVYDEEIYTYLKTQYADIFVD